MALKVLSLECYDYEIPNKANSLACVEAGGERNHLSLFGRFCATVPAKCSVSWNFRSCKVNPAILTGLQDSLRSFHNIWLHWRCLFTCRAKLIGTA